MSLEAAADELQRRARPAGRKGPLDEEALHDAILREVEERWEHLEAMRAAGKARRCGLGGKHPETQAPRKRCCLGGCIR